MASFFWQKRARRLLRSSSVGTRSSLSQMGLRCMRISSRPKEVFSNRARASGSSLRVPRSTCAVPTDRELQRWTKWSREREQCRLARWGALYSLPFLRHAWHDTIRPRSALADGPITHPPAGAAIERVLQLTTTLLTLRAGLAQLVARLPQPVPGCPTPCRSFVQTAAARLHLTNVTPA